MISKGCSNFNFGNARTTLNGGGGSGEPTTREVVQGVRTDFGGSAAEETSHATNPVASISGHANTVRGRRRPTWEDDGINITPEGIVSSNFSITPGVFGS